MLVRDVILKALSQKLGREVRDFDESLSLAGEEVYRDIWISYADGGSRIYEGNLLNEIEYLEVEL